MLIPDGGYDMSSAQAMQLPPLVLLHRNTGRQKDVDDLVGDQESRDGCAIGRITSAEPVARAWGRSR